MRGLLLVSILFLGGCYKYVPLEVPTNTVERGTELRAYFIEDQSVDLHDVTAHNITAMDVEFVRQEDGELVLSAFYLDSSARDAGYLGNGWTVRVPAGEYFPHRGQEVRLLADDRHRRSRRWSVPISGGMPLPGLRMEKASRTIRTIRSIEGR